MNLEIGLLRGPPIAQIPLGSSTRHDTRRHVRSVEPFILAASSLFNSVAQHTWHDSLDRTSATGATRKL